MCVLSQKGNKIYSRPDKTDMQSVQHNMYS